MQSLETALQLKVGEVVLVSVEHHAKISNDCVATLQPNNKEATAELATVRVLVLQRRQMPGNVLKQRVHVTSDGEKVQRRSAHFVASRGHCCGGQTVRL